MIKQHGVYLSGGCDKCCAADCHLFLYQCCDAQHLLDNTRAAWPKEHSHVVIMHCVIYV